MENEYQRGYGNPYITLAEYVKRVLADQPRRSEDLKDLVKVYGLEKIDSLAGIKKEELPF